MVAISAKLVKELRDKTGAGMMDCKKALVKSEGDIQGAIDELKKAGITKAEKKSGRSVNEGRIASVTKEGIGVMLELLCETDFVAKNKNFQALIQKVLNTLTDDISGEGDVSEKVQEIHKDDVTAIIAKLGENTILRRAIRWETSGKCTSYMHMGGKIGVIVDVDGLEDEELLRSLAMHIAAFDPQYVTPSDISSEIIAKEKEIAEAQVAGKPANIIGKIVDGKINKWFTEVCLVKQPWVKDDKTTFEKLVPGATVKRFLRWQVGEEI